jgi:hypothetical protein
MMILDSVHELVRNGREEVFKTYQEVQKLVDLLQVFS